MTSRILVVGLGSPIMSDDAVGLRVAETIEKMGMDDVDVRQEAVGGLDIIPILWGYRHAVIVDAIQSHAYDPGTVMIFDPEDFEPTVTNASAHEINLATAMHMGRNLDPDNAPESVRFVAIEVEDIITVSESMTPPVEAAVPKAVDATMHIIKEFRDRIAQS